MLAYLFVLLAFAVRLLGFAEFGIGGGGNGMGVELQSAR